MDIASESFLTQCSWEKPPVDQSWDVKTKVVIIPPIHHAGVCMMHLNQPRKMEEAAHMGFWS